MRILIIEDDQRLTRLMKQVLEEEKMAVDVAHDGDTGLELALRGMYDVAVIDCCPAVTVRPSAVRFGRRVYPPPCCC